MYDKNYRHYIDYIKNNREYYKCLSIYFAKFVDFYEFHLSDHDFQTGKSRFVLYYYYYPKNKKISFQGVGGALFSDIDIDELYYALQINDEKLSILFDFIINQKYNDEKIYQISDFRIAI